jgi:hypothetical protein
MPKETSAKQRTESYPHKRCKHMATDIGYHGKIHKLEITTRNRGKKTHLD